MFNFSTDKANWLLTDCLSLNWFLNYTEQMKYPGLLHEWLAIKLSTCILCQHIFNCGYSYVEQPVRTVWLNLVSIVLLSFWFPKAIRSINRSDFHPRGAIHCAIAVHYGYCWWSCSFEIFLHLWWTHLGSCWTSVSLTILIDHINCASKWMAFSREAQSGMASLQIGRNRYHGKSV